MKKARSAHAGSLRHWAFAVAALLGITPGPAWAQTDNRGQTVTDREKERVESNAHAVGGFLVSPQFSVSGSYDDNIYATDADRRGDVFLTFRPQLAAQSTWSRNALNFTGFFERDVHAKYAREDVSEFGGALDGRYDISRQTRLFLGVAAERDAEQRGSLSSFSQSAEPVRYTSFTANLGGEQEFGSLRFRGEGRFRRLSYSDAVLADGSTVDQSFRNLDVLSGSVQAGYDLNTLTRFVVRATAEQRRYDLRPGDVDFDPLTQTDRSGDSLLFEAGVSRELTELLSGTARVGYLRFRYPDPQLKDVDAFSYFLDLTWNVTPLTTAVLTAQRRVDETSSPTTAGNLRDEVAISVDHELLRALILNVEARYASIKPSIADGVTTLIDNSSKESALSAGVRYYIGRRIRVDGRYRHQQRTSDNALLSYVANRATIGASFMF